MKRFLCAAITIVGICSSSGGMIDSSPHISYHSTSGKFVVTRLADVNETAFQNMSPGSVEQISHLLLVYQQFISHSVVTRNVVDDSFSASRSSIISTETQFLSGTGKDLDFLSTGYLKLSDPLDETELGKFDNNLKAMYAKSSNSSLCRNLAESYKELAESLGSRDDFIRAAFWFRMLYASGEHGSYLTEYKSMRLKAGL